MQNESAAVAVALALSVTCFAVDVVAQTTAGASATIVVPVIAQTSSFGSEITVYNPNAVAITVIPVFYEAQNTTSPGAKACTSLSVGANVSTAFSIASQCALPAGSNFGLLVLTESTGTQRFYGYARTQTPQGVGFATEGFPIENFNDQIQHSTGLKLVAASAGSPAYQTNCFVATLGDAVNYELRLFDGGTNVQLGSTLSGSLAPFQQFRYLDVFAKAGVAAGNKANVRAQFTNLTGNQKKLIGFCTVQENTNLSADFRIAKSYGSTPQNAFVQGGNAFGTTALLGTLDSQSLEIQVNGSRAVRYQPDPTSTIASPIITAGATGNTTNDRSGSVIAGGGANASQILGDDAFSYGCVDTCINTILDIFGTISGGAGNVIGDSAPTHYPTAFSTIGGGMANHVASRWSTIGGGAANLASGESGAVAGGFANTASGIESAVSGGYNNVASGLNSVSAGGFFNTASGGMSTVGGGSGNSARGYWSTVAGGFSNEAGDGANANSGVSSYAAGYRAKAFGIGSFVWADNHPFDFVNPYGSDNVFAVRSTGGVRFVTAIDGSGNATKTVSFDTSGNVNASGVFNGGSDRNAKGDIAEIDSMLVLRKVAELPITTWRYKSDANDIRHIGPMAQDFRAAFGLGLDDKHIATVDADGVLFASIKALYQLVDEKDAEIADLRARAGEVEFLRGEVEALRATLMKLVAEKQAP